MNKPKYQIEIDEDGGVKVEGCGFKGKGCELPKELLAELGSVTESKKLPEYYQGQVNLAQGKQQVKT